jgi:hypothetical protein
MSKKEVEVGYLDMSNGVTLDINRRVGRVEFIRHLWVDIYRARPGSHVQDKQSITIRVIITSEHVKSNARLEVLDGFDWKVIVSLPCGHMETDLRLFDKSDISNKDFQHDQDTLVEMFKAVV